MECGECRAFELDSVVVLGSKVVPLLSEILHQGPPPDRLDRMREALDSTYQRLTLTPGITAVDSSQWVSYYLAGYNDSYRGRAAWALGQIGGRQARQALDAALAGGLSGHVRAQVRYVLDSVCGVRAEPGDCQ